MKWLSYFDKIALVCGQRKIHYTQMMQTIIGTGKALKAVIPEKCHVAIIGANSPEWVMAMYSIWYAGATVVPIDFMSTPEEIAYILDDCTPAVVFCDATTEAKVEAASKLMKSQIGPVKHLEKIGEHTSNDPIPKDTAFETSNEELAFIIYTSGTTGNPKGVMLTFGNLQANTEACSVQTVVFIPDDRVLVLLPLHHAYPLMATVVMPMSIGAMAVFSQSMTSPDIMAALKDNQCTFIVAVPRLVELFRNSIMQKINASFIARCLLWFSAKCNSLWLSRKIFKKVQDAFGGHLRYISSGGAANNPIVTRDFYALGFHLLEGYGMTEAAPLISFTPPTRHKPGSPGIPVPCNEVKIQDGEVCIRGKNIMKGYYHLPEETARVKDKDGWLHTGDLGYIDEDGFLFLTGRSKELIILGNGKNISPDELERKLVQHSDGLFTDCAVSEQGQILAAVIVPDKEVMTKRGILNIRQTIMDSVIEPYNEEMPSYKRISTLILREQPLPRTRLGKLRRHIIRQQINAKEGEAPVEAKSAEPMPDTPIAKKVIHCLEEIAGRTVQPDEHFELELNLDSLAKMNLVTNLCNALNMEVPVEMIAKYPTARTLTEALAAMDPASTASQHSVADTSIPHAAWTHGLVRTLMLAYIRCISKIEISGRENIPDGPVIFAPNHQSSLDGLYLAAGIDAARFKKTYFYVISKFISGPFTRWFANRHNMIAMEINGDLRQSIGKLATALKQGNSAAIFPEGTRSMDGSLGEFRPAFAQLSVETGVPVVPVVIDGAFNVLPRNQRFPSLGKTVKV
ncbi:MAG: AMP-binding protein, partial [Victivallales bacterium]|nr:AMP-binding protein [Victivallales bacterium]